MRTRLFVIWFTLRGSYWFVPSLMASIAIALALGSVKLDEYVRGAVQAKLGWVYAGGPAGARAVLATIAGSIITVAGTTFSITIAAFSLASSQFGPRLLRTFRRDTGNQIVLGTFIATFVYCLLVLRTIRGTESDTYVPHLSVTLGVVLACLSLGVLIYFIHHTAASIQVSNLIDSVGRELDAIIVEHFPENSVFDDNAENISGGSGTCVLAGESGYLLHVDYDALVKDAADRNIIFRLLRHPGEFIVAGTPLVEVRGAPAVAVCWPDIKVKVYLGPERSPEQDVEFGFLQLAEIGVRALSPGINDPFTAAACIDRISSSFCVATARKIPASVHRNAQGELRLLTKPVTCTQLTQAAFRHILHAGKDNPWVLGHLCDSIAMVLSMTGDEHWRLALTGERALVLRALDAVAGVF